MVLESKQYLISIGWSQERKVELPKEYLRYSMNDRAKNTLENLYGLTLKTKTQERTLILEREDFDFANEYILEANDDYHLLLNFYPLGVMSEFSGYIFIDDLSNFYLLCGELYFLGSNLQEFIQAVVLENRDWVAIDYPDQSMCRNHPEESERFLNQGLLRTLFNGSESAPWLFDPQKGLIPYPNECK